MQKKKGGYRKVETANVFQIQSYSIHDGPGIRTTVFVKGCPLRCRWCHNPESWYGLTEEMVLENSKRKSVGRVMSVEDVMYTVRKDKMFYEYSGGGVTISGGEPLSVPDFSKALLLKCKEEGIHTAVETSGYAKWDTAGNVLGYADLIFMDLKAMDEERHRQLTGVGNQRILENITRVYHDLKKEIVIRMPVIPECNDDEKNITAAIEFLMKNLEGKVRIQLLPYHNYGVDKQYQLGRKKIYRFEVPSEKHMETIKEMMSAAGLNVQIGGSM